MLSIVVCLVFSFGVLPYRARRPTCTVGRRQKAVALHEKASTIEAKVQSFIPGKLIVVSMPLAYRRPLGRTRTNRPT